MTPEKLRDIAAQFFYNSDRMYVYHSALIKMSKTEMIDLIEALNQLRGNFKSSTYEVLDELKKAQTIATSDKRYKDWCNNNPHYLGENQDESFLIKKKLILKVSVTLEDMNYETEPVQFQHFEEPSKVTYVSRDQSFYISLPGGDDREVYSVSDAACILVEEGFTVVKKTEFVNDKKKIPYNIEFDIKDIAELKQHDINDEYVKDFYNKYISKPFTADQLNDFIKDFFARKTIKGYLNEKSN